jgi:hypothetical protein
LKGKSKLIKPLPVNENDPISQSSVSRRSEGTAVRDLHPKKAKQPIVLTEPGIVKLVIDVLEKEESEMLTIVTFKP